MTPPKDRAAIREAPTMSGPPTTADALESAERFAKEIREAATANGGVFYGPRATSLSTALAEDCARTGHAGRGRACLCCGTVTEEPWPNVEETDRG